MKLFIALFLLVGCTDADMAQLSAIGRAAHITCYSGGKIIYEADSTGKISTESDSDGWFFSEKPSGRLVRISGTCVVKN